MLVISEALALLGDNLIRQFAERREAPVLSALGDWIDAASGETPPRQRSVACLGKANHGIAAEAHLPGFAPPKEAQDPLLHSARGDGNWSPSPSPYLPGFAVSTLRAVSLPKTINHKSVHKRAGDYERQLRTSKDN